VARASGLSVRRIAGLLALLATAGCRSRDSITLTLENVGEAPLDSVVVFTTGRQYPVGRLPGGGSIRLRIGADGESHIEVEHGTDARRRLRVGTYFEGGYGGKIDVRLTVDSIVAIADSITI
jgi:hypothetical protein